MLLNSTDYFLYLPLLPEVAAGVVEPSRISVPLTGTLNGVRVVIGEADHVDLQNRWVGFTQPEGDRDQLAYDRLVLAVGSVNKLLPIPGVTEYAHGFRGLPEALYLHDHVIRQIELAEQAEDPAEQRARSTFVVVGAGYTGTEVAAHGQLFTDALRRPAPAAHGPAPLDAARRRPPGAARAGRADVARPPTGCCDRRGVDVRMGTSVAEATPDGVKLTDGEYVPDLHAWSGASGCAPTRSSTSWACAPRRAGWWSTSSSTSPATPRCTPAATPPPCPT